MIHVRTRCWLEADEDRRLAAYAMRSNEAVRRYSIEDEQAEDLRLAYQRDRDRVLHARAFRRLKHKTQVFVPHVADHPRTRLTHTLEVGQLGRSVARALGLNEDLVEAIAMAHDLGHTAFGHSGETTLDRILHGLEPAVGLPDKVVENVGAFKHNYQSLRVVDLLERRYQHPGLNLTDQVREGILKHTRWQVSYPFPLPNRDGLALNEPCHLEGQAVAVGDEIAQQTHDLEDGLRAGRSRRARGGGACRFDTRTGVARRAEPVTTGAPPDPGADPAVRGRRRRQQWRAPADVRRSPRARRRPHGVAGSSPGAVAHDRLVLS
jgi:dGTPase